MLYVIIASLCSKYFTKVSQNFIVSKCYESTDQNEKFVVVYNLHIFIVLVAFTLIPGFYTFAFRDFFFEFSFTTIVYWLLVGLVVNMRWLLEHFFRVEFDNFNLDKNFSYKLISVVFAHFLANLLQTHQLVTNVEWISFFVLLLCSLYINSLQYEMQIQNVDFEQFRPSIYSLNEKNNSIYVPTDN